MNDDETDGDVVELEREQRIRRKVQSLGEDIEAAGEAADFADDPEGYLQRKAATVENDQRKQTYSVSEAADVFGVDPESVRRWIRRGDLKASKVGRGYRISRHDMRNYYQQRGGGRLFEGEGPKVTKFAAKPTNRPGATYYMTPGQSSFAKALDEARDLADDGEPAGIEVYRVADHNSWNGPDYEIDIAPDGEVTCYRMDWQKVSADSRQTHRIEIERDELLSACGLEWPEGGRG